MKRNEIIRELSRYFKVKELVCPHIYSRWGECVNGNQKCSDFGNSECSIFGIKTTVLLASAVQ